MGKWVDWISVPISVCWGPMVERRSRSQRPSAVQLSRMVREEEFESKDIGARTRRLDMACLIVWCMRVRRVISVDEWGM